jgi:hypothetical protein
MHRTALAIACAATALLVLVSARGEAPVKVSEWVSIEDLYALAGEQLKTLGQQLASQPDYAQRNEKDIPRAAGALACVAQAIAEHSDKAKLKVAAPALRDAALQIAKADAHAAAATALQQAQAAYAGQGHGGGEVEFDWTALIDVDSLMDEVNERNAKLVLLKRRIRRPESESLHAVMAAVMSLPIHALSESYVAEEDAPKWHQYSLDYGRSMSAAATAIRSKDTSALAAQIDLGNKACDACHVDFRD